MNDLSFFLTLFQDHFSDIQNGDMDGTNNNYLKFGLST